MFAPNKWFNVSAAVLVALSGSYAAAGITAGPGYSTTTGGYRGSTSTIAANPGLSVASANGNGLAIGSETYYTGGQGTGTVSNAFVLSPNATNGFTILNQVPGSSSAYSATALDTTGSLIVGTAQVTTASTGATVWTPDGTAYPLPLPTFTGSTAAPSATGRAINNAGTVVGGGNLFTAVGIQGSAGFAYYNANNGISVTPSYSGGTPVQLLPLGPSSANANNNQSVIITGISDAGLATGSSSQSPGNSFATIWNVGNTAIPGVTTIAGTMLSVAAPIGDSNYNLSSAGASSSVASISTNGVAGGSSNFFVSGTNTSAGFQPVRWTPAPGTTLSSATAGVVLTNPVGYTSGGVLALNANGAAVGSSSGTNVMAAVLWKAGTTAPITLATVNNPLVNDTYYVGYGNPTGVMINSANGYVAKGINDGGYSVGFAEQTYNNSTPVDGVVWDSSGNVTELNSLIAGSLVPVGGAQAGWVSLVEANSITNDGWISGLGVYYDPTDTNYTTGAAPTGTFGVGTYYREFLIQDTAAVPEPASAAALITLSAGAILCRRRRFSHS